MHQHSIQQSHQALGWTANLWIFILENNIDESIVSKHVHSIIIYQIRHKRLAAHSMVTQSIKFNICVPKAPLGVHIFIDTFCTLRVFLCNSHWEPAAAGEVTC